MKTSYLILLLLLLPIPSLAGNRLQELYSNINHFIAQQKAEIGVAIIAEGKDTLTIGNNHHYPLMSVFKLHQALAVGNYCEKHRKRDRRTQKPVPATITNPDSSLQSMMPDLYCFQTDVVIRW